MEKDFDYSNDEKSRKIIECLTPKYLNHTMTLKKIPAKSNSRIRLIKISSIAATVIIAFTIGLNLLQPDSARAMPPTSKEILTKAIKAMKELKSISLEFDARINSATPDYAECSPSGELAKCRYVCLQDGKDIIQRVDFDFDTIKVCNIYVNDTVYMWKDKELLYKGIKESPTGLKSIVKIENVLNKFSDYEDIKIEESESTTTLRHEATIEGGSLIITGCFDKKTGLLSSCKNYLIYEGANYPIVESTKMEYDIPIDKEDILTP